MFSLNDINDNSILITPSSFKKDILLLTNRSDLNLKFLSKSELKENIFFSYKTKAKSYLYKKGYSLVNAQEVLDNLYYLKKGNQKINNLINIKEELEANDLLIKNENFKYLFKNKHVYIYHYSKLDRELLLLLKLLEVEYTFLEDEKEWNKPQVHEYEDIEQEVDATFNAICQKVKKEHLSLNDIKLYKYPSEYDLLVKKYASFYHLPINFKQVMSLFSSPLFKRFLVVYEESETLEEAYLKISEEIKVDHFNFLPGLKGLLIKTKDAFESKDQEKKYLIDEAKNIFLQEDDYLEGIDLVDYNYLEDANIFIMGFNLLSFPQVNKDVSYLNDQEKAYLGINTSDIQNKIQEDLLIAFLKTHNKLYLSYKNKVDKTVCYPSLLIDKLGLEVRKEESLTTSYSSRALKEKIGVAKDLMYTYRIKTPFLNVFDENSSFSDYRTFDNSFKSFESCAPKDVVISPTSLTDYYSCPFKYYLKYVLYLNNFKGTFATNVGNFFHKILEETTNDPSKTIEDYRSLIDEKFTSSSERFFANNLIGQLQDVIALNDSFLHQENKDYKAKTEFEINYKLDSKITLKGKIDKMITSDELDGLLIVDYKTGSTKFEREKVPFGLSLQLPFYDYISSLYYENKYQKHIGFYIQNVLFDGGTQNDIKLDGITYGDDELLKKVDSSIVEPGDKSEFIKGLRLYNSRSKSDPKRDLHGKVVVSGNILDQEAWNQVMNEAKVKIIEGARSILKGEFKIAPKSFSSFDNACSRCPYKSICYVKHQDIEYCEINKVKKGDDDNA